MEIVSAFCLEVDDPQLVDSVDTSTEDSSQLDNINCVESSVSGVCRVKTAISPFFFAFYEHHTVRILVDSGATSTLVSLSFATRVGLTIKPTQHGAKQLDKSPLHVSGEVKFSVSFGDKRLIVDGLVNSDLDCDILAGTPFCLTNKVDALLSRELISIDGQLIPYGSRPESVQHTIYRAESTILRNDRERVLYPGDYLEINSTDLSNYNGQEVAIEPRVDSPMRGSWPPPAITRVIQGSIRIPNHTDEPVRIAKCQHFAQINRVTTAEVLASHSSATPVLPPRTLSPSSPSTHHSAAVHTDDDLILPPDMRRRFFDLQRRYDGVFNPRFGRYNGASGPFEGHIKLGNVEPPSTKTKIPFYHQTNLQLLQHKADELDDLGVLIPPEVANVDVKFASPSFLRRKPNGDYRFVTSFTELGQYTQTLPVAVTPCDKVIRELAKWKFVVKTDLTQSFFQIPISKSSMPYLATVTPFKGLRVYTTLVMGMPGSSEILQELMSRIFGAEMTEGWLLIIQDDMYICSDTPDALLRNWETILEKLSRNGLTLSAVKTFVCPKTFDALGWKWTSGTLSVSPHKITPLASAEPPKTCSNMRSFIGAFKAMSRCIPRYSSLMSPLEDAIKGLTGPQHVVWTDSLLEHFARCKEALKNTAVLTVPTPTDKLVLTVDASPVNSGIAGTLYACRGDQRLISECFSVKLKSHHLGWEPCELEALAIASAIQHFAPYIRESKYPLQVLTDNRPCVQAYAKLRKGHFSASARVSTFLSNLSQYSVIMTHLKGSNNTSSDYASRHPQTCTSSSCQICKFVSELSDSVVNQITVEDVLSGASRLPFLNKTAWLSAQHDSQVLRRVYAHLTQGTRPSKKAKNIRDVKRYLSICTLDSNGLIIVRKPDPFVHQKDLIVVPHEVLPGLLTALHIQFNHPTRFQMGKLFDRHFYAIASPKHIEEVTESCSQCNSLKKLDRELFNQSSSSTAAIPGELFASDVIRRRSQRIFATRDVHTSYTTASIITDETADSLRGALLDTTSLLRMPSSTVRVDNAPGFLPLKNDSVLGSNGLTLDFGRVKNANKNPVAEKANQELEAELLRIDPSGSPVSASSLKQVLKIMNTRIRNRGLSAQEMLFCRDQTTGQQLSFEDRSLSQQQHTIRDRNHLHSSMSKARGAPPAQPANLGSGDLVYIKSEGNKNRSRDLYLVMNIDGDMATIQKLRGSKFLSRRYEVPLTDLFQAITPPSGSQLKKSPVLDYASSTSSDEESSGAVGHGENRLPTPQSDNDSSDEFDEANQTLPRRSTRVRVPPAWYTDADWTK